MDMMVKVDVFLRTFLRLNRCMWYLDSGASFNMTGTRDHFSDLEEKDLQQNIEFGDEGRYNMTGISKITF